MPTNRLSVASPKRAGQGSTDVDAVTTALLTASRLLVAISARSLTAVEDRVTLPQFRTLVVLATRGPMNLIGLAEVLDVNPSTATRMTDRLSAAGLLSREVNPDTRREIVLTLTSAGRQIVEDVTAMRRTALAEIVARMPPPQRAGLVSALRSFAAAGGEPAAGVEVHPLGWA
jgi:DNA-binding MarR family transcriptional regulator